MHPTSWCSTITVPQCLIALISPCISKTIRLPHRICKLKWTPTRNLEVIRECQHILCRLRMVGPKHWHLNNWPHEPKHSKQHFCSTSSHHCNRKRRNIVRDVVPPSSDNRQSSRSSSSWLVRKQWLWRCANPSRRSFTNTWKLCRRGPIYDTPDHLQSAYLNCEDRELTCI